MQAMKLPVFLPKKPPTKANKAFSERNLFIASLFIVIIEAGTILANWKRLPPEVPLFYSRPWGEAQLAPVNTLFILPLVGAAIAILNFLLSRPRRQRNPFISWTMATSGLVLNILIFITTVKIISIVL